MYQHATEYVCAEDCGYQCTVGNAVESAKQRSTPNECPACGGDLVAP